MRSHVRVLAVWRCVAWRNRRRVGAAPLRRRSASKSFFAVELQGEHVQEKADETPAERTRRTPKQKASRRPAEHPFGITDFKVNTEGQFPNAASRTRRADRHPHPHRRRSRRQPRTRRRCRSARWQNSAAKLARRCLLGPASAGMRRRIGNRRQQRRSSAWPEEAPAAICSPRRQRSTTSCSRQASHPTSAWRSNCRHRSPKRPFKGTPPKRSSSPTRSSKATSNGASRRSGTGQGRLPRLLRNQRLAGAAADQLAAGLQRQPDADGSGDFLTNATSCTGIGPADDDDADTRIRRQARQRQRTYTAPIGTEEPAVTVPFAPAFALTPETTQSDAARRHHHRIERCRTIRPKPTHSTPRR